VLAVAFVSPAPAAAGPTDHHPAAAAPAAAPSPAAIDAAVLTIQNTCFAAYPPDLMAAMSGHPGPPPDPVLHDPALQMKYLRSEKVEERGVVRAWRLERSDAAGEAAAPR
jgi:hypothetical protein